ncbi:MAG TPA: hypothetical protein EYP77_02310, partial [Anaerolineae bacterium]|nr:hypothetical protein [Anaerolineae bacterium]
ECDLVVIDEVGPMELKSPRFIAAVTRALEEAGTCRCDAPLTRTALHVPHPRCDGYESGAA